MPLASNLASISGSISRNTCVKHQIGYNKGRLTTAKRPASTERFALE
jgi:hypothetical protein